MKSVRIPLLAAVTIALLACTSCIVRSVNPWLKDSSLTFDEDLLGGWVGVDEQNRTAMTFTRGKENFYIVQYSDKDQQGVFEGRLAKFGGELYLDFRPLNSAPGLDGMLLFPTHSIARLELSSNSLAVHILNYEAVKAAAKLDRLRRVTYSWDVQDEFIFTSSTEEMQGFLLNLGKDSDLYSPPIRLTRKQ